MYTNADVYTHLKLKSMLRMVVYTSNPLLERLKKKNNKFKGILGYKVMGCHFCFF